MLRRNKRTLKEQFPYCFKSLCITSPKARRIICIFFRSSVSNLNLTETQYLSVVLILTIIYTTFWAVKTSSQKVGFSPLWKGAPHHLIMRQPLQYCVIFQRSMCFPPQNYPIRYRSEYHPWTGSFSRNECLKHCRFLISYRSIRCSDSCSRAGTFARSAVFP